MNPPNQAKETEKTLFPQDALDEKVADLIRQQKLLFEPVTVNPREPVDYFLQAQLSPEDDRIEIMVIRDVYGKRYGEIDYYLSTGQFREFSDAEPGKSNFRWGNLNEIQPPILLAVREALIEYPLYSRSPKARQLFAVANKNSAKQ